MLNSLFSHPKGFLRKNIFSLFLNLVFSSRMATKAYIGRMGSGYDKEFKNRRHRGVLL